MAVVQQLSSRTVSLTTLRSCQSRWSRYIGRDYWSRRRAGPARLCGRLSNHPLRHGADVHGGILLSQFPQRLLNVATYDVFSTVRRTTRMTNPDDAEITRSNDARFRDQSNPPIHKS